jgi:membrane protease YdiL (CAAX protease family)
MTPGAQNGLPSHGADDRLIAIWEIVSVTASCLIAVWIVQALAQRDNWIGLVPVCLALALMFYSHRERGESLRTLGFRSDNFFAASRLLVIPTVGAIALIILLVWTINGAGLTLRPLRWRFIGVPLWAVFQQYALQGFINRRAQIALGPGVRSVVLVAAVFGILHLPSPLFASMAFAGALVWAAIYQRTPNLFALGLSHFLVSLCLSLVMPVSPTNSLRFGFKYFGLDL